MEGVEERWGGGSRGVERMEGERGVCGGVRWGGEHGAANESMAGAEGRYGSRRVWRLKRVLLKQGVQHARDVQP